MVLLFFYLTLALGVSFLCSILEAVILSVPLSYIHAHAQQGQGWARTLLAQKEEINRPLSAILALNTIAHTIGAAGVGAQAVALFGKAWFGLISAVLTLLILFLSEIIPKTLGATYWRELARLSSQVLRLLIVVTLPLVWISEGLVRLLSRKTAPPPISRTEIEALAHFGTSHGIFEERESRIISNLVGLRNVRVGDIMTPRTVIVAAPDSLTVQDYLSDERFIAFSRLPLYGNDVDRIESYLLKADVITAMSAEQKDRPLADLARPLPICPEHLPVPCLLNLLLENREKIALVTNEYGGTEGVATMEDVLETLLGQEIIDELDQHADMQSVARQKWEKRRKTLDTDCKD